MKKKKIKRSPAYSKRSKDLDPNMAFFNSPYFKYVVAGTAVILLIICLAGATYLNNHESSTVLGAQSSSR